MLDSGQPAAGDDDLSVALGGEQAGCRITEPGRGAGDERERMFHSVSVVKGEARRSPRDVRSRLVIFELFGYILQNEKVAVKEF